MVMVVAATALVVGVVAVLLSLVVLCSVALTQRAFEERLTQVERRLGPARRLP